MKKSKKVIKKVMTYIFAIVVFIFMSFPIYTVLVQSLQYDSDIRSTELNFIPSYLTFDHYISIFDSNHIVKLQEALFNSLFIAISTAIVCVIIGLLAAYAVSRLKVKFGGVILYAMSSIYILPTILFVIPLFVFFVNLGINDTYFSLILLFTAFVLPFSIWALKAFVDNIPIDIDNAARIDGCNQYKIFMHIYLPLMKPGIVAAFLFAFILSWIEFLTPLVFTSNIKMLTVELGLYRNSIDIQIGQLAAAAIVTMIPVVILVLFFQKLIIQVVTGEEK